MDPYLVRWRLYRHGLRVERERVGGRAGRVRAWRCGWFALYVGLNGLLPSPFFLYLFSPFVTSSCSSPSLLFLFFLFFVVAFSFWLAGCHLPSPSFSSFLYSPSSSLLPSHLNPTAVSHNPAS